MKLRPTKIYSSPRVHSFLFLLLARGWVVWEVFPPPPECSPPPEWIGWGGGYEYARGGGYVYVGWAWAPVESAAEGGGYGYGGYPYGGGGGVLVEGVTGGGGHGYGGGAPDEAAAGGGGYGYGGGYDGGGDWKRARGRDVDEALDKWRSREASTNSIGMGAYKVEVLRKSHYVWKFRLQLFNIV
jgi:hypothetical protein